MNTPLDIAIAGAAHRGPANTAAVALCHVRRLSRPDCRSQHEQYAADLESLRCWVRLAIREYQDAGLLAGGAA